MISITGCIVSLLKIIWYKLRYGSKTQIDFMQQLNRLKIKIYNSGTVKIGKCNQSRCGLYIVCDGGRIEIGNHCYFNINASVASMGKIKIGDRCTFGNNLVIVDHDHNIKTESGSYTVGEVIIGNNTWIGANVVILKNTIIGSNCVIGAGSVIGGEIQDNTIVIQKRDNKFVNRSQEV